MVSSELLLSDLPCRANQHTGQTLTSSPSILIKPHPRLPPPVPSNLFLYLPLSPSSTLNCFPLFHLSLCPLSSFPVMLIHPSSITHPNHTPLLHHQKGPLTNLTSLSRSLPPSLLLFFLNLSLLLHSPQKSVILHSLFFPSISTIHVSLCRTTRTLSPPHSFLEFSL